MAMPRQALHSPLETGEERSCAERVARVISKAAAAILFSRIRARAG